MDHFERNGLRFDVLDSGPEGASAVVLLHGFPQQPSSWDAVAGRLQADGLRTLVPTERGYTAAARPTRRRDYTMAETAADVVALLDAAGIDHAHIVGHDWGGGQAWAVAALYPERVTSLTVLSSPHPAAMMKAFRTSRQGFKSWYMAFFQLPLLPEVVARRTLTKMLADSGLPADRVQTYAAAMAEPGVLSGALNWYRGIPFSARTPIGAVRVPTTYIWGRHDFALSRAAAELTASYVTGPYAFIELDSGHWLPETNPVAVANAIGQRVVAP